ncbi:MAG TPA: hypothetical protein VF690_11675 [Hymenobacter sp.]|jgi:hypothetical protein
MKKMIYLLALVGTACQQQKPPAQSAVLSTPSKGVPAKAAAVSSLPPATQALLQQHDLAALWSGYEREDYTWRPMEGFYGPPHYRISFYFSKVERDSVRPNLFHVTGLDRYKKVITPFSGTITVDTLQLFTKKMFLDAAPADSAAPAYTAIARFALNEDPTTKGAGNYVGQALLDFYIDSQQHLQMANSHPMASEHNPTRGAGLIFRGYHVSNQTGRRKSVAFSTDYSMVVPEALAKLGLGDRSEEVNPNLARLGWNEAWENDEWWAESPKPSLL